MNKELLRLCKQTNVENVLNEMLNEKVDYTKDAICDRENLIIDTGVFLKCMCEMNDVTNIINTLLYEKNIENIEIFKEEMRLKGFKVDSDKELCIAEYTYNESDMCDLEKDIVYKVFYLEGENCEGEEEVFEIGDYYALIQIHTGTKDARSGFSSMVAFKLCDVEYFFMGKRITGYISNEEKGDVDFETSYEIEEKCKFDEEKQEWYFEGEKVILNTCANGF